MVLTQEQRLEQDRINISDFLSEYKKESRARYNVHQIPIFNKYFREKKQRLEQDKKIDITESTTDFLSENQPIYIPYKEVRVREKEERIDISNLVRKKELKLR